MKRDLPRTVFLADEPRIFRGLLLNWFDRNRRDLPWRRRRSVYGTWISEMMLQQTTVKVVVPYWEKFLDTFPDVHALAAADVDEVLGLWSGLGYYRRARQLHEAARMVVEKLGGEFPCDQEGWLALPGIGPYASGAVASIAQGKRVPAVDANARRVFSRWLVDDPESLIDLKPGHLQQVADDLVDDDRPGDWNEAVMELGATVCRAADPACPACPVRSVCRAHLAGIVDQVPPPKSAPATRPVRLGLLVVEQQDRVLLVSPGCGPAVVPARSGAPVRNDVSGLHVGLWGLPATPWLSPPATGAADWPGRIWRPWLEGISQLGYSRHDGDPELVGGFRHAITRYRLEVKVYRLQLARPPFQGPEMWELIPESQPGDGGSGKASPAAEKPMKAGFSVIPSMNHPVSNLVTKSLRLAGHSSV